MTQEIKQPMSESDEQMSALMDGALTADECASTVTQVSSDPGMRASWDTYHLVGDVLRQPTQRARAHDPEFLNRLRVRLATEALGHAQAEAVSTPVLPVLQAPPATVSVKHSANDGQWRLVVGLASVMLVATLIWQGLPWGDMAGGNAGAQMAQQQAQPTIATAPVMIRDPQLDALLAAQRQFSGTPTFHTPAGFLRNATFENGGR